MSKFTLLKLGIFILVALVLLLVLTQFLSVNQSEITLNTYFGALEGHLGRMFVISFLVGGVFGYLAAFVPSVFDFLKIKRLNKQLQVQKKRLEAFERQQTSMVAHADLPGE